MYLLKSVFWFFIKEAIAIMAFFPSLIYLKVKFKNKKVLIVLNYHNFSKYNNYRFFRGNILETGYSKNFEKQIRFYKNNFKFIYPDEFYNDHNNEGINILITFDDGYKDNYDLAFPILKQYGAKCIFFVATDFIDTNKWLWHDKVRYLVTQGKAERNNSERILKEMNKGINIPANFKKEIDTLFEKEKMPPIMMNWGNLKEIKNSGLKIGAHTNTHKILSFLTDSEQDEEIKLSIDRLNIELGFETKEFAYPNGSWNNYTIESLKKMKINHSFIMAPPGINNRIQNKLKIKRIGINASDSISLVVFKIFLSSLSFRQI